MTIPIMCFHFHMCQVVKITLGYHSPFGQLSRCCRSGFTTLVLLQEQSAMVLLLERDLVSWSLAIDEYGGHEDLCGLGRCSIIPYVHGRTELYCSSLPCLSLPICPLL
jgi:hypothetical protein